MNDFIPHISETIDHIMGSVADFKPELALIVAFLAAIFASLFLDSKWKLSSFVVFVMGIVGSFYYLLQQVDNPTRGFFGMLNIDRFSVSGRGIILFALLISGIFIQQHFKNKHLKKKISDVYSVLLATGIGLHLLAMSTHWILVFIGIEMVSIGSYILVAYFAENKKQSEAAMKYVLFGSTCAAFMLYGLSLIYGFTGTLDFASTQQMQGLMTSPTVLTTVSLLFVFVGIGFKLGFVPFHVWTPDVYEGAPTPVTAFLSTVPKISAIILFSRLFQSWTTNPFYFGEVTLYFLFFVAIITMLIGNLIALRQQNIKRLMAYSSIGHTGFLLMAMLSYVQQEPEILLFYLMVYTLMNLAIFGFIDVLEQRIGSNSLDDFAGLGKKWALLFICMTWVGISLVGLPPTAGFVGKLLVFTTVFDIYQSSGEVAYVLLLIAGVLTSVISLFYYLKIPLYAFLRKRENPAPTQPDTQVNKWQVTFVIAMVFGVMLLLFGIFPHLLLGLFA